MSRKKGLSREELEIQRVLSPSSQGTQSGGVTPGQTGITIHADPAPQAPVAIADESMEKLATLMGRSISLAVKREFRRRDRYDEDHYDDDYDDYDEDDYDDFIDGTDRANSKGDEPLEVNVIVDNNNNDIYDVPLSSNPLPLHGIGVDANTRADKPVDPVPPTPTPAIKIDKSLPQAKQGRPVTNWYPCEEVLAWAADVIDGLEMTDQDRKDVAVEFSPEVKWDHLFTAVSPPEGMTKAMEHAETKRNDYLFNRFAAEQDFQRCHADLTCGMRLVLQVISDLKKTPGTDKNRYELGRLYQFMTSAASHGMRGRRELGRKFVPLENQPALFATQPSHYSFFGGPSVESAVTQAVADTKVNKDLVIMPKKRPFRFGSTHPGGKSYYNSRGSRPYRYQNSRSNYNNFNKKQNFYQGRRGRGRGTRRKPRQGRASSKPSTQE